MDSHHLSTAHLGTAEKTAKDLRIPIDFLSILSTTFQLKKKEGPREEALANVALQSPTRQR